ncbi:hypothetical protein BH10ACI1_BH10ACI1_20010 [soil metagenome]
MQIQSVSELAYKVANDPAFEAEVKADPIKAISNVAAPLPDTFVYKIVVISLGATVLLTVIGAIVLVAIGKGEIPASIIALGSAAVGALAGLLAPAPSR